YDSWVRPVEDGLRFTFGRCIHAEKPRQMWVDWKKTGIRGYTSPDDGKLQAGVPALTKDSESIATELWFASKPRKTDSNYLAEKHPKVNVAGGSLKSYARMSLGRAPDERRPNENILTVKVDLEFESSAFSIGGKRYLYTVSWRNREGFCED